MCNNLEKFLQVSTCSSQIDNPFDIFALPVFNFQTKTTLFVEIGWQVEPNHFPSASPVGNAVADPGFSR